MTAPALHFGFGGGPGRSPGTRSAWGSTAVALVLTALLVLFLALGFSPGAYWLPGSRAADASRTAPERVTFVDVPPATLPPPAEPLPGASDAPATSQPNTITAPQAPDVTAPAQPGGRTSPAPVLPADSAPGRTGAAGRVPPRAPAARLPDGITFPPPARPGAPAAECVGPCRGGMATGVHTRPGPLTGAERDSALRAIERSIPGAARELGRRDGDLAPASPPSDPGAIPQLKGASIPVGLPGGGPSKAQRERDRRIHAENAAALARIRARQDSIRADSLERARRVQAQSRTQQRPPDGERE